VKTKNRATISHTVRLKNCCSLLCLLCQCTVNALLIYSDDEAKHLLCSQYVTVVSYCSLMGWDFLSQIRYIGTSDVVPKFTCGFNFSLKYLLKNLLCDNC